MQGTVKVAVLEGDMKFKNVIASSVYDTGPLLEYDML